MNNFELWQAVAGELFFFKIAAVAVCGFLLLFVKDDWSDGPPSTT